MSNPIMQVNSKGLLPLAEAIQECTRELQVRQRCYSRWIDDGKLTRFEAEERLNRLSAAIGWLERYGEETAAAAKAKLDTSDYTLA